MCAQPGDNLSWQAESQLPKASFLLPQPLWQPRAIVVAASWGALVEGPSWCHAPQLPTSMCAWKSTGSELPATGLRGPLPAPLGCAH